MRRLRAKYYELKCWFLFHHKMESLGKVGEGKQLYQCSFCFKRIVVKPFGIAKGTFESKVAPPPVPQQEFMRGKAVGGKR